MNEIWMFGVVWVTPQLMERCYSWAGYVSNVVLGCGTGRATQAQTEAGTEDWGERTHQFWAEGWAELICDNSASDQSGDHNTTTLVTQSDSPH